MIPPSRYFDSTMSHTNNLKLARLKNGAHYSTVPKHTIVTLFPRYFLYEILVRDSAEIVWRYYQIRADFSLTPMIRCMRFFIFCSFLIDGKDCKQIEFR